MLVLVVNVLLSLVLLVLSEVCAALVEPASVVEEEVSVGAAVEVGVDGFEESVGEVVVVVKSMEVV